MTIFALSTASGRAGIAVIRISGGEAGKVLSKLCRAKIHRPRVATLRTLRHPESGQILDRGLVLWFPAPASFTGEDMAELHVHGGRAVIDGVFDALASLGLRLAEPGEFTKRAFENGKIDLTEAEGLADLINAETAAQRQQAMAQAGGALRKRYENWRSSLLRAMAFVEASLDFADEGDVAESAFNAALPEVQSLAAELERALAQGHGGEIIRSGIQVAIIGAPNVGKSSLLNALAGRDAAIVFDEPGTTRDVIEVAIDLGGYPFVLRDTAGLREAESAVEREGMRRALASAAEADIVLLIDDASDSGVSSKHLTHRDDGALRKSFVLLNKIDLVDRSEVSKQENWASPVLLISAKTGEGLNQLKTALIQFAREHYTGSEAPLITRARHRQEIERANAALKRFLRDSRADMELLAEDLREASDALGRLVGRLDVEDVLGQIFSEFCIGK